ncbi:MAG: hypothetical protein WC346_05325 [Methanogenium sp.]
MSDNKNYCCEGNAYLQNAFDILLELHEKTITYRTFSNENVEKFIDAECALWTLRDLIKRCPWCHPELTEPTRKEDDNEKRN